MSENIPKTLSCPACGAPLDFDGRSTIIRCKFCQNVSLVPTGLPIPKTIPTDALDEIRRLAREGQVIEAIRRYRELANVGLKEAKEAVEALRAGRLIELPEGTIAAPSQEQLTDLLDEIKALIKSGNKLEAIKRYRLAYDVSLAKAKHAIDELDAILSGKPAPPPLEPAYQPPLPEPVKIKSAAWSGVVFTLAILLFAGGIITFALLQPGGPFVPRLIVNEPAIFLPSTIGGPIDIVALFYNLDAEERLLGMVSTEKGKIQWKTEPLSGSGYVDIIVSDGDCIFTANEEDLLAFRISDGSLAWQVEMPDRLNYGESSLVVLNKRVISLTLDRSLQAYDAQTGQLVWSHRLSGYDNKIHLIGDRVMIMDYLDDEYTYSMIFIDPIDGSQQLTITPACSYGGSSTRTMDTDSGMEYDATTNSLYLIFGYSPGCIQRYDLGNGELIWQFTTSNEYSFSHGDFNILPTESRLYFDYENQLLSVEKSTGVTRTLIENEDYEFIPLIGFEDELILRARRTRGSERFEIWGVETISGNISWQVDLENAEPLDPPDEIVGLIDEDLSGWTWHPVPEGLLILEFQADPAQLVLQTIDPASGTILEETRIPVKNQSWDFYSAPTIIGWQSENLYFVLESKIYTFEPTTGSLTVAFP